MDSRFETRWPVAKDEDSPAAAACGLVWLLRPSPHGLLLPNFINKQQQPRQQKLSAIHNKINSQQLARVLLLLLLLLLIPPVMVQLAVVMTRRRRQRLNLVPAVQTLPHH